MSRSIQFLLTPQFLLNHQVGLVWQYTSLFEDAHTRRAVLKGGSNYQSTTGSYPHYPPTVGAKDWYFPQARNLSLHNIMLLMSPSYERAGTVGFRCVKSAKTPTS